MDSGLPKRKPIKSGTLQVLEGRLERITYQHADSYYTVARFRSGHSPHPINVTGHLPGVKPGEMLRIRGRWEIHPRFGSQFNIRGFRVIRPASAEQIETYLSSGVVKGIGAVMARRW